MVARAGRRSADGPGLLQPARIGRLHHGLAGSHCSWPPEAASAAGCPASTSGSTPISLFPSGADGLARCHMAGEATEMTYRVIGSRGEATAANFVLPHLDDRLFVTTPSGDRVEHLGTKSSYTYQLEAHTAFISRGRTHGDRQRRCS